MSERMPHPKWPPGRPDPVMPIEKARPHGALGASDAHLHGIDPGSAGRRTPMRIALFLVIAAFALAGAGCGSSYSPGSDGVARAARPRATVYDMRIDVPGIAFPLFGANGLFVDLTFEIDADGIDASGTFRARVMVREVRVGGVPRPFRHDDPLHADGVFKGGEFSLDSFGPIDVGDPSTGTVAVFLSVTGTVSPDGRSITGLAIVTSSSETGTFHAVRQRRYVVASTDFGVTGTVSLVTVRYDTAVSVRRDLEAISGDPIAVTGEGGVFIVNRFFFDNVQVLDPATDWTTALQFSTGNGSNPHDALAVDPNRIFITRYEPPYNDVLIADRHDGAPLGFVDLVPFATNPSGTPRADSLVAADGRAIVSLQNIDGSFRSYGPGVLVALRRDGSVDGNLMLQGRNPIGRPAVHPDSGLLYYAMAGIFEGTLPRDLSGGIERVDPVPLATDGLIVDDDDLGGNVSAVALVRAGAAILGYCVVTLPSSVNVIRAFDPDTGAILPGTVWQSTAFIPALASDDDFLLIPLHDAGDPRLVILHAGTGAIVGTPRLSLPPFSIAVLRQEITVN